MSASRNISLVISTVVMASAIIGCTSIQPTYEPIVEPLPDPSIIKVSIVTTQRDKRIIPVGSRIVITNITGDCAKEVKDALMQRLVDNADYDVLTRDNLEQILRESDLTTSMDERLFGKFTSEASAAIGELLGASLFIVGRVSYCGESSSRSPDSQYGKQYNVQAALQILDLNTGKVLLSSASRGHYLPLPASSLPPGQLPPLAKIDENGGQTAAVDIQPVTADTQRARERFLDKINILAPNKEPAAQNQSGPVKTRSPKGKAYQAPEPEDESYLKIKAAEAMANEFADKFFARSIWEIVKMWNSPGEEFSQSVRHVQLGHCQEAVNFLENEASAQLESMADSSVAKYLHNYGVALLCANNSEKAIRKLQSAYRVVPDAITLEMLGLASRVNEWGLEVEVDQEPEIGMLMRRDIISRMN